MMIEAERVCEAWGLPFGKCFSAMSVENGCAVDGLSAQAPCRFDADGGATPRRPELSWSLEAPDAVLVNHAFSRVSDPINRACRLKSEAWIRLPAVLQPARQLDSQRGPSTRMIDLWKWRTRSDSNDRTPDS